jgi:hypothetical protein
MIVKRIAPLSLAKISGVLYAIIGLIIGCGCAMISMVGGALSREMPGKAFGAVFGVGAIIFFPILYGVLGFVGSLIGAAIYNLLASAVGGVEVELVNKPGTIPPVPAVMPTPHA